MYIRFKIIENHKEISGFCLKTLVLNITRFSKYFSNLNCCFQTGQFGGSFFFFFFSGACMGTSGKDVILKAHDYSNGKKTPGRSSWDLLLEGWGSQ